MAPFESFGALFISLVFHGNYGRIFYHFRDKARHLSKIAIFSYPRELWGPRLNIATTFNMKKTRMVWLPDGEKGLMICLAVSTEYRRVTTDEATSPYHTHTCTHYD